MNKTVGITQPISVEHPKAWQIQQDKMLTQFITEKDPQETQQEKQCRVKVIRKVRGVFNCWLELNGAANVGGTLYTFGSIKLGVFSKGADVDIVCIVPKCITRNQFFSDFPDFLRKQPGVRKMTVIAEAFVPVIKFLFDGVEVDLLFASLNLPHIPKEISWNNLEMMSNMDLCCIRSLNGYRVSDEILSLVPNIDTFRQALRALKLWAKSK